MRKVLSPKPSNMGISLESAKKHIRVEDTYDDSDIESKIKGATLSAQAFTGLQLTSGTFLEALDGFAYQIKLLSPLTDVAYVKYYDVNNLLQTIPEDKYRINTFGKQHFLEFDHNYIFPTVYNRTDAVLIEYTAGYTESDIPSDIVEWIKIRVDTSYNTVRGQYVESYNGRLNKIDDTYLNQMLYPHKVY